MIPSFVTGVVEKLIFGGEGLVREQGFVIFVPEVIPGEEVHVEIISRRKNFARARLVEIRKPSLDRIQPLCRHFGVCGGCQLQHIDYARHAEIKKGWIEEAFYGLYEGAIDCIPAAQTFFWRRKITVHASFREGKWVFGYFGADNKTIVPIDECPLFFKDTETILFLKKLLQGLPGKEKIHIDMELLRLPSGKQALKLDAPFSLSKQRREALLSFLRRENMFERFFLRFGSWSYAGKSFFEPIPFSALGRTCYFSMNCFVQNHVSQGERLWKYVVDQVDRQGAKQTIFDLYSGIGVTAIGLAEKKHHVIAVEGNKYAAACVKKSCEGMQNKPIFVCDSVERALSSLHTRADTWILNPPRTGLSKNVIESIQSKTPTHIVYVSCSPATAARDMKKIVQAGWNISSVQGYDMFPQTTHLEVVCLLSRPK